MSAVIDSPKRKKIALIAAPWVLLLTTYLVYQGASAALGPRLGYPAGFLFYWIVWCFGLPLWILGPKGILALFRDLRPRFTSRRWLGLVLLLAPLLLAYGYEFPRALPQATLLIVLVPGRRKRWPSPGRRPASSGSGVTQPCCAMQTAMKWTGCNIEPSPSQVTR